ncbi:PLP-dependent cysteine synthase family protein [Glaciibacter superstes]|uniref:PLP-dependent cysteine synthase family protein n=1 Tax=Glaciibacter superstes TaxID=501023 RepID=UPI0003B62852|nr:cysteine synthase family protein [Glaciibacter superstes]
MSSSGALAGIGDTPLVELRTVVPANGARVFAKLEWANPTGSMKDRMARAAIEGAVRDGLLKPGGTVVEYTAGTTGISLAFVCAVLGFNLHIVFSDAFSQEKRRTMLAFGATVEDIHSDGGAITESLVKAMIARAAEASSAPGNWWCDQLNNRDAITGYLPMGEEIWEQSHGRIDAFVHAVGTAHSLHGVARALHSHDPSIRIFAVEPSESAVLSGGPSGPNRIEGIGIGFVPPLWEPDEVDDVLTVSADEAMDMARRLAREEGLFAGTSSGANVVAALRVAERLGPDARIVTIMCDSGLRYLSTELYRAVGE